MVIVAKDGNGDYTGVQAAVDALPETGGQVLIRAGEYREKIVVHSRYGDDYRQRHYRRKPDCCE